MNYIRVVVYRKEEYSDRTGAAREQPIPKGGLGRGMANGEKQGRRARELCKKPLLPIACVKLGTMLLRWNRSYAREQARFARIVWKRSWPTRVIALFDRAVTISAGPRPIAAQCCGQSS